MKGFFLVVVVVIIVFVESGAAGAYVKRRPARRWQGEARLGMGEGRSSTPLRGGRPKIVLKRYIDPEAKERWFWDLFGFGGNDEGQYPLPDPGPIEYLPDSDPYPYPINPINAGPPIAHYPGPPYPDIGIYEDIVCADGICV